MSRKSIDYGIDLAVASDEAYRAWTDFAQFPLFMDALTRVTVADSVRSRWEFRVANLDWEFDALITKRDPGRLIEWRSTAGEVTLIGRVVFEPLSDSSCRMTMNVDWTPHGPVEHVGALFGDDTRIVKHALANFKAHIETGALDTAP